MVYRESRWRLPAMRSVLTEALRCARHWVKRCRCTAARETHQTAMTQVPAPPSRYTGETEARGGRARNSREVTDGASRARPGIRAGSPPKPAS